MQTSTKNPTEVLQQPVVQESKAPTEVLQQPVVQESPAVLDTISTDSLVLVDADSIYFRAACISSKKNDIRKSIDHTMSEIEATCMMGKLRVAVKGKGNFRKDMYPEYKANRKELDEKLVKSLAYGIEHMISYYDAFQADGMEADDLVSIWAYEARELEKPYFVVGIDKDLLQIPGNHYNFNKQVHTFVDDDAANLNLNLQCLIGDNSDNIPGIKGIGKVKAAKILDGVPMDKRWDRVKQEWKSHNAGDPDVSRRLLTMLKSWKEYDDIRQHIQDQATVCEQNVRSEGQEDIQES